MKTLVFLLLNILILIMCKYNQEHAKITYWNPKYISKATSLTKRTKRRDHYRTNVTITITQAWGNNITMKVTYKSPGNGIDLNFNSKICDLFTQDWYKKFLSKFTNMKRDCPVPPGTYAFINVDFDSSVIPLPMPSGKNFVTMDFYITRTHERVLEGNIIINFQ